MSKAGYKHLTLKQRKIIELFLNENAKLVAIANEIFKDYKCQDKNGQKCSFKIPQFC